MTWSIRKTPACRILARNAAISGAKPRRRNASGLSGASPQFWPDRLSGSGGAPIAAPGDDQLLVGPGLGAVRIDPDREVAVEPDRQPGFAARRRRTPELAVGMPLQELEELDAARHAPGRMRRLPAERGSRIAAGHACQENVAALLPMIMLVQRLEHRRSRRAPAPPALLKRAEIRGERAARFHVMRGESARTALPAPAA